MEYQPYLKRIPLFEMFGLKITWKALLIGLMGPGKFIEQLTTQEIIDYTCHLLEDENVSDEVLELASCTSDDKDEIKSILNSLSEKESTNFEKEELKWQVVLLSICLEELSSKAMYGMIELTEFWEKFSYPQSSPHRVQGKDNNLSPNEYYSEEFFYETVSKHREWIMEQIQGLKD